VLLYNEINPWEVMFGSPAIGVFLALTSVQAFTCLVIAGERLYFHVKHTLEKNNNTQKLDVSLWLFGYPHLVLSMQVVANLVFLVYCCVDPTLMRGIFTLTECLVILDVGTLFVFLSLVFFQLYWLHLTKKYRTPLFLQDRSIKIALFGFVFLFQLFFPFATVYAIYPPQENYSITMVLFFLGFIPSFAVAGVYSMSLVFITAIRVMEVFKGTLSDTKKRAKKITVHQFICLGGLAGVFAASTGVILGIGPITTVKPPYLNIDPLLLVWFFLCGVFCTNNWYDGD